MPAWSNSRNEVVAKREEEREKAKNNDRQRKRIRFDSKPTTMYNGAGKISKQVRPYYDYGRHSAAVEVGAKRDSAGEHSDSAHARLEAVENGQANSDSAHARLEAVETGQANSHSVYSRLESGQENRAQAAQERREPGENANVGGKLEPPTEPNPWGHLVLDRDAGGQLKPPTVRGKRVLGRDKGQLKRENKRRKIERQLQQSDGVQYWKTHEANPEVRYIPRVPREHRGQMDPAGPALEHPAAHLLDEYATFGCPANTGKNWTLAELEAAIEVGSHVSAMVPEAMQQLQEEVTSKVANGQVKVFLWDDLKKTMPPKLKISRIAMIPHKSKPFRAILDLSFPIQFQDGTIAPVNETTTKTAPRGSMDQMGQTLQRLIYAYATADEDTPVFAAKEDIKDGFWRLVAKEGEEWNFAYVLPQEEGQPKKIVVPTSLQMGWIESPGFFNVPSETGRDVAEHYAAAPIGSLPEHKFLSHTQSMPEYLALPDEPADPSHPLQFMMEVYVDDYISLAVPRCKADLDHLANATMHGIHSVFPANADDDEVPISLKKLKKFDGAWAINKDLLGWTFDGIAKSLELEVEKLDAILATLKSWCRAQMIPFEEFRKTACKVQNATIAVPAARALFTEVNKVIKAEPRTVFIQRNKPLLTAVKNFRTLLQEAHKSPTKCRQLVVGHPDYVGIMDAAKEGTGGVVIGEGSACVPTVFRLEWPQEVQAQVVTEDNPDGTITNSDLEMAGLLLCWLVLEHVAPDLYHKHIALFCDNSPTVAWVMRMATRASRVAGQLLMALALRMKVRETSPLTTLHIAGDQNSIADIPSRSFGGTPKWHCRTDDDFLKLYNSHFPLPKQQSWTVFQIPSALSTRVISILLMKGSGMAEWRRLPTPKRNIHESGSRTANLWESTLTWRKKQQVSKHEHESSQDSQPERDEELLAEAAKLELAQSLQRSRPLARRFPWTQE